MNSHGSFPGAYTRHRAVCSIGKTAIAQARETAERIARAKASYEAERRRRRWAGSTRARRHRRRPARRPTTVLPHARPEGLGDAAALVGRDFFDAVAKTEVSATTAKFRLSLVQAIVADDDLVRDAGAARKGATFVERVLGAVAANKPRRQAGAGLRRLRLDVQNGAAKALSRPRRRSRAPTRTGAPAPTSPESLPHIPPPRRPQES